MLQLKHRDVTPQGGWQFRDEDGTLLEGGDIGHLVKNVLAHRVKIGLPTENLFAIVEDGICRQKPVKCSPPKISPDGSDRKIGAADVWRFVQTMKEWLKDRELVSAEEAERRAEICAGCQFNGEINDGSCWGCTNIMGIAAEVIAERKTRVDHALKNCRVCACFNQVQVWTPLDVLWKAGNIEMPADTGQKDESGAAIPCWKRKPDVVQ